MRKVKTNRRNRIFGLFAMFAMAIGVGVSLAPREVVKTEAAYTKLTNVSTITSSKKYVLGVDETGKGFHYSGTSSWGLVSTTQAPYEYELTVTDAAKQEFTAKTVINGTTYYLTIPTSNTFTMSTNSATLKLGTNSVSGGNIAINHASTANRHLRLNGTSGLRSYATATGDVAYFYEIKQVDFGTLDDIEIDSSNVTKTFYVNDEFNREGLLVTAYDEEGADIDVSDEEGVSTNLDNKTFDEVGEDIPVNVTFAGYGGSVTKTAAYYISVKPAKTSFEAVMEYKGSTTTNMKAGNNAEVVELDPTLFNVVSNERDPNPLYTGLNSSGQIRLYNATNQGNILTVSITHETYKITSIKFNFGGTVSTALIKIENKEVHSGSLTANGSLEFEELYATSFSIENKGTAQIYILSVEIEYGLAAERVLTDFTKSGTLAKSTYYDGETFDPTGLEFTAEYNEGDFTSDVTDEVTFTPSPLTAVVTSVTASYTYEEITKTIQIPVTVSAREIVSIQITNNPEKMEYSPGDAFDSTGMVVKANYNFGDPILNYLNYTFSPDGPLITLGNHTITITSNDNLSAKATLVVSVTSDLILTFNGSATSARTVEQMNNTTMAGSHKDKFIFTEVSAVYGIGTDTPGIRLSSTSAAGSFEFKLVNGMEVSSITISAMRWDHTNDDSATLTVNDLPAQAVPSKIEYNELTFNFAEESAHIITVVAEKRSYIESIRVEYVDVASEFDEWVMVPEDVDALTEHCLANFTAAKSKWNALNPDAQDYFKTDAKFADARARLINWGLANKDSVFDVFLPAGPESPAIDNSMTNNPSLNATLIIGLLGLTTMAGYYFLSKKEKFVK